MSTITEVAHYCYGHGKTSFYNRLTSGLAGKLLASLPEVNSFEITLETTKVEHVTRRDPLASVGLSIVEMVKGTWKLSSSQHIPDLIALYAFGTKASITGGSFSAVAFPTGVLAGETWQVPGGRTNITTWTSIVDSAGSPLTLVAGTDYEYDDGSGEVKFINVPGTQPYKISGTEAPSTGVGLIQSRVQEIYIRHKEINIANADAVEPIDIYRCQVDPAASWKAMGDGNDVNSYEIGGQILKDTTVASSATFGQYGRWRQPN